MRRILVAIVSCAVCAVSATAAAADPRLVYGRYTCKQGYVWRDAVAGDRICVAPRVRAEAAHDSVRAAERRQPGGGAYGIDTCRQGFVWREATPNRTCPQCPADHACVSPTMRARIRRDNDVFGPANTYGRYQNPLCAFGALDAQDQPAWESQCRGVPD